MSTISSKEKNMLLIGAAVVLYGIAALCYKAQMPNWKKEQKIYQAAEKKLHDERALIAARERWKDEYDAVRVFMPVFPYEKDMRTHWLRLMDDITSAHELKTTRLNVPDKDTEVGDVSELPIDCKDWEGTLEALVNFLYDVSTQEGAMLDVRHLYIKPTTKAGILKGTFTLYSAYMRGN
ncbi:MAG: hypothetical protein FWG50_01240 [Kiritimatiellaeota bacterium]|nr:hypothetical protein [Kiritimatiellota bacterium]